MRDSVKSVKPAAREPESFYWDDARREILRNAMATGRKARITKTKNSYVKTPNVFSVDYVPDGDWHVQFGGVVAKLSECDPATLAVHEPEPAKATERVIKSLRTMSPVPDPAGMVDRTGFEGSRYVFDKCTDGIAIRSKDGTGDVIVVGNANIACFVLGAL